MLVKRCEVKISSNVKFFKLNLRGKKARSWGNIWAFKSVKSQSTAKIFLAPDHTGSVDIASMLWSAP